jgi:hypothetical protein
MNRQRLNILSHAEGAELNRHLKDAMKYGLIRPSHSELGSPILWCLNLMARFDSDYRGLNEVTRKDAYSLPRVDNPPSMS